MDTLYGLANGLLALLLHHLNQSRDKEAFNYMLPDVYCVIGTIF